MDFTYEPNLKFRLISYSSSGTFGYGLQIATREITAWFQALDLNLTRCLHQYSAAVVSVCV